MIDRSIAAGLGRVDAARVVLEAALRIEGHDGGLGRHRLQEVKSMAWWLIRARACIVGLRKE